MIEQFILTGANGDIAFSIGQIIKQARPKARLIGTDINEKWPALELFDEVHIIPKAGENDYFPKLHKIIQNNPESLIIPCTEPELKYLAENQNDIKNINFLMNDANVILRCLDKFCCMNWLREIGVAIPETRVLSRANELKLPIIVKPRYGSGSRNIEIIRTSNHLEFVMGNQFDTRIAQQYLDIKDQEYTCALLTYDEDYKSLIMHRKLKGGLSDRIEAVTNVEIQNIIDLIAKHIPPYSAINIQLRLTSDGPKIFEINPRFSSTVKMRSLLGFNDLLWAIQQKEGCQPPKSKPILNKKVYRGFREIIAGNE